MEKLRITTDAFQGIVKSIGSGIPEKGGIVIGKDGVVTDFIFDEDADTTGSTYTLNVPYLNPIIKAKKKEGKQLLGIVHSHPSGSPNLSPQDREYFQSQFKNFPHLDYLFTPIILSAKQQEFSFIPHVFHKNGTVSLAELEILPNDYEQYLQKTVQPDPATVTERKELLIVIRQENPTSDIEREHLFGSEPIPWAMILSNILYFVFGLATAVLLMNFFLITKHL